MGTSSCCISENDDEVTFGIGIYEFKKKVRFIILIQFLIESSRKRRTKKIFYQR